MMTPIAMRMSQQKSEYLAGMRCPIKEFQESLEITKCGVMQYVGRLARDPATVGGIAVAMYLVSLALLSPSSTQPPSPF